MHFLEKKQENFTVDFQFPNVFFCLFMLIIIWFNILKKKQL